VLFTDVLSGVTAHVREKRSTWGIAIEDADMTDLDQRPIADVRFVPGVAGTSTLAKRKDRSRRPRSRTRSRSFSASIGRKRSWRAMAKHSVSSHVARR
jgi:hypothetical protein